jgi:hypothetical protein
MALYFDFYLTGCVLSNYKFTNKLEGYEPNFLDCYSKYKYIGFVQVLDILLNFLKVPVSEGKFIDAPEQVALLYIKNSLVPDIIAVLQWVDFAPNYIFMRYLKVAKFNIYQNYFDEFIMEFLLMFCAKESVKTTI